MEMKEEEESPLMFFAEIAIVELEKLLNGKSKMVEEEQEEKEEEKILFIKRKMKMKMKMVLKESKSMEEEEEKIPFIKEKKKKRWMEEGESSNSSNYNRPYKKMKMEKPAQVGWVEAHARMQNSSKPVFVFEKQLTKTDTTKHHNRLLIRKECAHGILLPALGYRAEDEERVLGRGIDVLGLDQMGRSWDLQWKWWKAGDMQVLTRQWFQLLTANAWEAKKDYLQVFMFRYGENQEKICFAITSLRKKEIHKKEEEIHKKEVKGEEEEEEEEGNFCKKKRT